MTTCIGTSKNEAEADKIDGFLLEALKNLKDRTFILKIEHTVTLFMADPEYTLPPTPISLYGVVLYV